jgi:hypothetical protein
MAAIIERIAPLERTIIDSVSSLEPCSCGLAMAGHGDAYNEEAFHHFLAVERKRSELSGRPFLLLLVEFEKSPGLSSHIDSSLAAQMFSGLGQGLRDTDVIGWYRDNRVAGAVLTDLDEVSEQSVRQQVTRRVSAALRESVSAAVASRVRVCVYELPTRSETLSSSPVRQLELV